MEKIKVGIENLNFDAANYTLGSSEKCKNLHGHTFTVNVEVEGKINEEGMVIDFLILKKIVKKIIEEYDHKVIIPEKDAEKTMLKGNFKPKIKTIPYPHTTTEYIALDIARKIFDKLKMKTTVRVYEGKNKYAEVTLGE